MFLVYVFSMALKWIFKTPHYVSTDECVNTFWFIHTVEYYSAMNTYEVLIYAKMD